MSLLYEAKLESDIERKSKILKLANNLNGKYENYIESNGYESCCHIPREQGEVVSLLTELVYSNQIKD